MCFIISVTRIYLENIETLYLSFTWRKMLKLQLSRWRKYPESPTLIIWLDLNNGGKYYCQWWWHRGKLKLYFILLWKYSYEQQGQKALKTGKCSLQPLFQMFLRHNECHSAQEVLGPPFQKLPWGMVSKWKDLAYEGIWPGVLMCTSLQAATPLLCFTCPTAVSPSLHPHWLLGPVFTSQIG